MAKKNTSIFKDITLTWWQAGLFKTAAVSFGILLALYFGDILGEYSSLFWLTFIISSIYIVTLYFKSK